MTQNQKASLLVAIVGGIFLLLAAIITGVFDILNVKPETTNPNETTQIPVNKYYQDYYYIENIDEVIEEIEKEIGHEHRKTILNSLLIEIVKASGLKFRSEKTKIQEISDELNKLQKVMDLIAKGADVNAKDENGETALHWAAYYGHSLIVRYLIKKGADPNIKGLAGRTPLDWANRSNEVIKILEHMTNRKNEYNETEFEDLIKKFKEIEKKLE